MKLYLASRRIYQAFCGFCQSRRDHAAKTRLHASRAHKEIYLNGRSLQLDHFEQRRHSRASCSVGRINYFAKCFR